ncbi:MAG: trigger factor [Devosiaceae bacterium]|nr:trigger factor [Devosiaceae bacterium]
MQTNETLNEGLKRKLSITIKREDLSSQLDAKLQEMKAQANIKGFRPGKVPVSYLKKVYGVSAMSEVMQNAINAGVQEALEIRKEKPAMQPKIDMDEDQAIINKVLAGEADLAFEVSYEILPGIKLMDFKSVKLDKPVVDIEDKEVETELERLFLNQRQYEDKGEKGVVADGDKVGLNFEGKVDGVPFDGGKADHSHLVIGSGDFIPGFEEKLIGMKKGDKGVIDVTFPKDYSSEDLAGKKATFDVEILHVDAPKEGKADDEFAKTLGMDNLDALKDAVRTQMTSALESMGAQRVKRQVLDALDVAHKFDVPEQLVEAEFKSIWDRINHELKESKKSFEDEGTTEEKAKAQYERIAERRVRLGLVVAEIGNINKIEIAEEELQQALMAEVRRFPGQEQEVYDYYRKNPDAVAGLRAPIYENKVVTFVSELAEKTEKKVTREELAEMIKKDEEDDDVPNGA